MDISDHKGQAKPFASQSMLTESKKAKHMLKIALQNFLREIKHQVVQFDVLLMPLRYLI